MSTASHKTNATADEFARVLGDGQRRELVLGAIRMMSPAGGRHGKVALRLGALLLDYVQAHNLGDVFAAETGFLLTRAPDTVRAPDVAFVKRERIETLGDTDLVGFIPLAPDLVAEVISPTDTFSQVEEKTHFWLKSGVRVVLNVDPEHRTVRVVRGPDQTQLLDDSAELMIDDVIPGWRLSAGDLFT